MDTTKEQGELPKPKKVIDKAITRCIYHEICSKKKMCGDCAADEYDREQYEEALANFR
jgi:hypothetical protein